MARFILKFHICFFLSLMPFAYAAADEGRMRSYHFGLMHPSGVDFAGYTVEEKIRDDIYRFYTFGFPSIAAIGLTYYENYQGSGLAATVGVGIGSVAYGSIAYQWEISEADFVKLGAGFTTSIVYNGAHPVLSYEHRLR
ncbi:MAG: hypothetical protein ABI479_00920 [Gallionella sp.]